MIEDLNRIVTLPQLQNVLNTLLQNAPDGTLAAPGMAFANDQASGFCRNNDGSLSLVSQGQSSLKINSDGSINALVPTLGSNAALATKMKQSASVTDFGVVHDPEGDQIAANTQAYLAAITACSGQARLYHPPGITAILNPLVIKVPTHLN